MPRLALALLSLVLAGCGASTYAQPKPAKLERAADVSDPLLGSVAFGDDPKYVLAIVTAPEVTSVSFTSQAVGTEGPFKLSTGEDTRQQFLVEAKGKGGTTSLVAVIQVSDPNGLFIAAKEASSGGDTLAIDSKLEARPCSGVEDGRKIAAR